MIRKSHLLYTLFIVMISSICGNNRLEAQVGYVKRLNAAGASYTTGGGDTFDADQAYSSGSWGYVGGNTYTSSDPIANTTDDVLYQSVRWDMTAYRFTVDNGSYQVILHFAETYYTSAGLRLFDVSLENQLVLDNYDIYADVGHDVAVQKSFSVTVSDGVLYLDFSASADAARISAIEVLETTSANPQLSVNPTTLDFGITQTSLSFTVTNSGSGTLNWNAAENPDESWITSVSPVSGSLDEGQQTTVMVTVSRSGLLDGNYDGTVSVTSNGGNQDVAIDMAVSKGASYVQRLNAGWSSYTSSNDTFDADPAYSTGGWGYVGGNTWSTSDPIADTNDDQLYQTLRYDMSAYRFTVDNGIYQAISHFADGVQKIRFRVFEIMKQIEFFNCC
ncbi:hypothetical protein JXJ21_04925 [candidate division KSB1 bacterium]|nr:hypothetical protein [candidate division KSB1 bacterium]